MEEFKVGDRVYSVVERRCAKISDIKNVVINGETVEVCVCKYDDTKRSVMRSKESLTRIKPAIFKAGDRVKIDPYVVYGGKCGTITRIVYQFDMDVLKPMYICKVDNVYEDIAYNTWNLSLAEKEL